MVDVKILPGHNALCGNYAVWRGRKGRKFALRIGKRRRDCLVRFIVRNVHQLPITVSLTILDRIRPAAIYPVMLGERRFVSFVVGQFFLLIEYDRLKDSVQKTIGETNFNRDELVDMVCS